MKRLTPFFVLVVAVLLAGALRVAAAPAANESRHTFTNSVGPLPVSSLPTVQPLAPENLAETQEIAFPLRMRDYPKLLERIGKGEVLTQAELQRDHLPTPRDYALVERWLRDQGFEITQTDPNRLNIFARGTLAQIQNALKVQMVKLTVHGREFRAAQTLPSLPTEIAAPLLGVNGLQPFRHPHHHLVAPAPAIGNKPPYLVKEVLGAYGAANLGVTGSGQTIAILIDSVPRDADLTSFWTTNAIPQSLSNIQKVAVNGTLPTDTDGEATLDVEWTSGTAPGAQVRLYATGDLSFTSIDKALQRIISDLPSQPNLHQLSISLGLGETYLLQSSEMQTESQYFATLASHGVSIFVASGDAGSNPDDTGHNATTSPGPLQVEYESSDPSVTGVGGTALTLSSSGTVTAEAAWSGSGGGASRYFSRPSWQTGTGVPSGTTRLVPDVALVASENTAAYLYFEGQAQAVGGTSWSTPTWAGFCALINEARTKHALPTLGLLNPKIYPLVGTGNFRDIVSGNNGSYSASTGYDRVTGLGVPVMSVLLQTLGGTSTAAATVTSFNPTSGAAGVTVTVNGTNLDRTTAVTFNGVSATFSVISATQLTATVPNTATSGAISVATPSGSASSANAFTVVAAAVANDNFAAAQAISGLTGSVTASTVNATRETGEPNHAGNAGGHSIWYTWTAPATGVFTFDTNGSSFDTLLGIYNGSSVSALTEVVSNDDAGTGVTSSASFQATSGTVYYVAVDGHNGQTGTAVLNWAENNSNPLINNFVPATGATGTVVAINGANFTGASAVQFSGVAATYQIVSATQISATVPAGAATGVISIVTPNGTANSAGVFTISNPPANDNFAQSQVLSGNSGSVAGTTTGATAEPGEPNHGGSSGGHSVWYTWTAATTGPVSFNTFGSSFNTILAVYTGNAVNALTPLASSVEQGNGASSVVSFNATAGVPYRVAVDSNGAGTGTLSLNWTTNIAAPTVTGFSPGTGAPGTQVTITGTGLGSVTGVSFGNTAATFGIVSDTQILAIVPVGATTAPITVTTLAGTATSAASFAVGNSASNDNFSDATAITGIITVTGTNVGATLEAGEPQHAGRPGGASVWWNWTAPSAGQYTITTLGSTFDTLLGVYTGSSVSTLTEIASNDDDPNGGNTSSVTFTAAPGVTYHVAVDGFSGASGDIVLSVLNDKSGTIFSTAFEAAEGYTSGKLLAGQNGWLSQGPGANGVVSNYLAGLGQQAYLGNSASGRGSSFLWKPVNYVPAAGDIVTFQVNMKVVDSTNRHYDDFAWQVYNRAGQNLFSIHFDNAALAISYTLDDGIFHDTGVQFGNESVYTLLVTMNFAANTWSASLDGQTIVASEPMTVSGNTLDLGDVDASWQTSFTPGNNYLLFDNYSIRNTGNSAPTILLQPQGETVAAGTNVNLRVVAAGSQPLTYQWRKNGKDIAAATGATLNLGNVQPSDAGAYDVVLANSAGTVTSTAAELGVTVVQAPNLAPYQPAGWSDRIVVSRHAGATVNDTGLLATDHLYVSDAFINNGNVAAPAAFQTSLYVDGVLVHTGFAAAGLGPNTFGSETGIAIGSLVAGTHQIQLVVDSGNAVAESNEADNVYTRNVTIGAVPGTYTISASASPIVGGSVSGTGTYASGAAVNLVATPAAGYGFVSWTLGGTVVSTSSHYSFRAAATRTYVANFIQAAAPTLTIASPAGANATTYQNKVALSGTATAGGSLTSVTWTSSAGQSGTATGASAWSIPTAGLLAGTNVITVTAHDANGTTASAQVTVTRQSFAGATGIYTGLVATTAASPAYLGRAGFSLSALGSFTGALSWGGSDLRFTGQFVTSATYTATLSRGTALPALQASLTFVPGTPALISGTVTDGTNTAQLQALPNGFSTAHPWPRPGRYTLALESNPNDTNAPRGHGYALVSVNAAGLATLTGHLADGTAISQSAYINSGGILPLYCSLYRAGGYIAGPLQFSATDTTTQSGVVDWTRPPNGGFSTRLTLAGSSFTALATGKPLLAPGNRPVEVGDGEVTPAISKTATLPSGSVFTITPTAADNLKISIVPTTGQITGTFTHPVSKKARSLAGVILQNADQAAGYFVGPSTDGYVEIGPLSAPATTGAQ